MASTKSLFTPYDSKSGSLSISSSKRPPFNTILKRRKSTFSQDYSHLNQIYCSLHNSLITIICTDPVCQTNCLLCEKCDLSPHTNHGLSNLKLFLQSSMSSLELKIRKQDERTLHQLEEIDKFTNQAESEMVSFVRCIYQQKVEIRKDSDRVVSAIKSLLGQWESNVEKMRKSLDETVLEVKDLMVRIRDFSNEESPLMKVIFNETSLDQLFEDLLATKSNQDAGKIQSVFKHLIKVLFYRDLHYFCF